MFRATFPRFLIPIVLLAVAPFIQPALTSAATLTLTKTACNITQNTPCGTAISAHNGDVIQYDFTYDNEGGAGDVVITDALQPGQTYLGNCATTSGPTPDCELNSGTVTMTMTDTGNTTQTVSFQVQVSTNTVHTIYNSASATGPSGGSASSGQTGVSVSNVTPTGNVTLTKSVADASTNNGWSTTAINAAPGDQLEYRLALSNGSGTTLTNVQITDQLANGQTLIANSCTPACSYSGNQVTFAFSSVGSTGATATFYVNTSVPNTYNGTIQNTAYATADNLNQIQSNTTQVTFTGGTQPPYFNPYPYPYPVTYPTPTYYGSGGSTICGAVSNYTVPTGGSPGVFVVNGETFVVAASAQIVGGPISVGVQVCVVITLNTSGEVASANFQPNYAGFPYVCGGLSNYNEGYYPINGWEPYPGYDPSTGLTNYGAYPYSNYNGFYGWNGPMYINGYPYQVGSNTYFPFNPTYGNPYCFMMGGSGYIVGSLTTLVTAARPAGVASARHVGPPQFR